MFKNRALTLSVLLLVAGIAYASPCTDRRLTCSSLFAEAQEKCGQDAACVEKAHKDYMACLAVDNCSY